MFVRLRWLQAGRSPEEKGKRKSFLHAPLLVPTLLFLPLLVLTTVFILTKGIAQGTETRWINPAGGNWSAAANWDNGVPDATKNAIIDLAGTYTVTLDMDATVASLTVGGSSGTQTFAMTAGRTLTLNGASTFGSNSVLDFSSGTLTGSGDVTVNGTMDWGGGTITGTGAFTVNGTMNISGTVTLDGRTITNKGTANWTGTGYVRMSNAAVFENQAGATLDIQSDSTFGFYNGGGSGTRSVNNAGTITKSGGTGTFSISVALNNDGTVNVNSGTMVLQGGGNHSGTFNATEGTVLNFAGGTHNLQSSSSVMAGTAILSGGTVNVGGTYNVSSTTDISGATANFTGTLTNIGSTLVLRGGTANFSGGEAVTPTTLTFSNGILTGSDDVTVSGAMDWGGGTITGTGAFTVNGTMNISGTVTLDGRTITNKGTANWTGTGYVRMSNAAVFENQAGATLDIQSDSTFGFYNGGGSGTRSVNNAGTITKSGGTGTFSISVALNNNGLVQVLIGTLDLTSYTQTATGTLEIGIGGLAVGEFGQLNVSNLATLNGTFKATLVNNFQPKTGDQFQVMTFGSRSGDFASFNLPEGFQAEYVGNGLTLTMVGGVVNQPPLAPTLLSPAQNATVTDFPLMTFQLSTTDPDNDSLKFKVELLQDGQVVRTFDQTRDPTGWDKPSYASGETAKLTVSTIPLGTYQWRAQAFDGRDWGAVSETRTLTIANTPPLAPTLLSPVANATVSDFPFTFQLSATDPDGHSLRFKLELLQDGQVVRTFDQTKEPTRWDKPSYASGETATFTVAVFIALGTYQWRAQAFDGRDWGAVSETRTFTFTLPELPLDTLKTVSLNAGETLVYKLNVPQADNLFVTVWTKEQAFQCTVSLTRGAQTVASQSGADVLLQVQNPQAGEYALEITSSSSGELVVRASTNLPVVKIGELFVGKIYHNDGYDWAQMDVPEGTKTLDFTLDAPGNVTYLNVWRGNFDSSEHWSASQAFNPPSG